MVDTTTANKDTRYYFELGNYHASQGDYTQAAQNFVKSIALDPNNEQPYINLANCYGMLKQYDKALSISNQLLAKNPNNTFALKNMAVVYNLLGDPQKSEEYLQRLREIEGK